MKRRIRVSESISASSVRVISAKPHRCSLVSAVDRTVWCGPPAVSHASVAARRSGAGRQTARATGSFGSGASGATRSISFRDQPGPVADVSDAQHDFRAGGAVVEEPYRILPVADTEWMDLRTWTARRDRRANLGHVRADDLLRAGHQGVRGVRHERGTPRHPGRPDGAGP